MSWARCHWHSRFKRDNSRFPEFDTEFNEHALLRFEVCSKIANVHMHVVTKTCNTGHGIDSAISRSMLTRDSYCALLLQAHDCAVLCVFPTGTDLEYFDCTSYCTKH